METKIFANMNQTEIELLRQKLFLRLYFFIPETKKRYSRGVFLLVNYPVTQSKRANDRCDDCVPGQG